MNNSASSNRDSTRKVSQMEECKASGNDCMKSQKFVEAMLHYTQAIKLDPRNHLLYSNRSLAFLKMASFYHAWDDAKTAVKLAPCWSKAYYRQGEAEYAAQHYLEALASYEAGLAIDPHDPGLLQAATRAAEKLAEQRTQDRNMPRWGVGIAALLALLTIYLDGYVAKEPVMTHWVVFLLLLLGFIAVGYCLSRAYMYLMQTQRAALLEEPLDLFPEEDKGPSTKNIRKKS